MNILENFRTDPISSGIWVLALLISVVIHEYGHALAAIWQGDDTPTKNGRFDWNPLRYLSGIGIFLFVIVGFGWLGMVQTRPDKYRNPVLGSVVVSMAGIVMNLALALIAAISIKLLNIEITNTPIYENVQIAGFGFSSNALPDWAVLFLGQLLLQNIMLAVFNAIPIPPLDGGHALGALEPTFFGKLFNTQIFSMGAVLIVVMILGNQYIWAIIRAVQTFLLQFLM